MRFIESLKSRLSSDNTLVVQSESGHVYEALFQWNQPISDDDLNMCINNNNLLLPESYIQFLKISNGAILFEDMEYGQWGCNLLGLQDMLRVTHEVRCQGLELKPSQFVFSTWLGDMDYLIFDTDKINDKKYIIDCYACDPIEYGTIIKWDFENWLDKLIVAQGAKFWRW